MQFPFIPLFFFFRKHILISKWQLSALLFSEKKVKVLILLLIVNVLLKKMQKGAVWSQWTRAFGFLPALCTVPLSLQVLLAYGGNVILHFCSLFEHPRDETLPYVEEVVRAGILRYGTVKSIWATAMAASLLKLAVSAMWKCGGVFSTGSYFCV